ncbi:hypothetical protein [Vibrio gazogenes]|uniref:hypothetical protein n=1 Tax=Vibrio gazogenes TaxID=687 RepID=UPI0003942AA0|nr:hypothetical protein [Vibrio gazogenes]
MRLFVAIDLVGERINRGNRITAGVHRQSAVERIEWCGVNCISPQLEHLSGAVYTRKK